jgi:hypothetical protein
LESKCYKREKGFNSIIEIAQLIHTGKSELIVQVVAFTITIGGLEWDPLPPVPYSEEAFFSFAIIRQHYSPTEENHVLLFSVWNLILVYTWFSFKRARHSK